MFKLLSFLETAIHCTLWRIYHGETLINFDTDMNFGTEFGKITNATVDKYLRITMKKIFNLLQHNLLERVVLVAFDLISKRAIFELHFDFSDFKVKLYRYIFLMTINDLRTCSSNNTDSH